MTVEELLNSQYAEKFDIEKDKIREGVLSIYKPNYIGFTSANIKIEECPGFVMIDTKSISLTLYLVSGTTHLVIF